jgi:hypothetical protein
VVWLSIAAAAVLLVFSGINTVLRYQRALRARQHVELALQITNDKLNHVQVKLAEASARRRGPDAP